MAYAEDAAAVLEHFVQDVANLPAEIAHLLEEIEAKDRMMQECRTDILTKDASLQKFFKANGAGPVNPKEEVYTKAILASYDTATVIQDEKVALGEKAAMLLDRHIKRLDYQIRHLQAEGHIDAQLPTLLTSSRRTPASTNISTPLQHSSHIQVPPRTNLATSASTRLTPAYAAATSTTINTTAHSINDTRNQSPATASTPIITTTPAAQPIIPAAAAALARRDSSSDPSKRRRFGLPGSSSLRQSSLGPGTAPTKASSLSAASGVPRAGSAGPRSGARKPGKAFTNNGSGSATGVARLGLLNPAAAVIAGATGTGSGPGKKTSRRKARRGKGGGVSDTGDESAVSEIDDPDDIAASGGDGSGGASAAGGTMPRQGASGTGAGSGAVDDEGDGDDRKYCTCRSVSYGNMVACDNDACQYEWFHWSCVGMTKEPLGKWYCDECRGLLAMK